MKLAIVGAGWAGLAAAVAATRAGHQATVFEASRQLGGRARSLQAEGLDNGQHILIGAYRDTLALMREVGVDPQQVLLRLPLTLRFPDGQGLALPDWPAPLDLAWGIATARGWGGRDKLGLLRTAARWQRSGFRCADHVTVAHLCRDLTPAVRATLVEPLCVSALNTPADRASGQVFLRVLRDAVFGPRQAGMAASNLLLPRADLGRVFPEAAARWLAARGTRLHLGRRVGALAAHGPGWRVENEAFDQVLLAAPPWEAARLVEAGGAGGLGSDWAAATRALRHEAIATVYADGGPRLPLPLLALRSGPEGPAQFVVDRGQLGGPAGRLAFVVSASSGDRGTLQAQVLAQAGALGWRLAPVQTVVEKRATFACTPGLRRPDARIAPGLWACGDYVAGPYPATLEGAVRSALHAVAQLDPVTPAARTARRGW